MVTDQMRSGSKDVDRGWSWVVAFACFFGSLVLAGIFRTSGVLFVAFIHTFGVSREEASWPMVVCIAVLNLTGPFSGILGQRFGVRPIVMIGAIIATIGISSCYFTTSLSVITILFGGVFGVGWGFMNTLMPVILNAYFLNLRATANGIANSGSCFGSIILPVVFEYLISSYGLSGCFLLTGGIVLHLTAAAALMRPPPWTLKRPYSIKPKIQGKNLEEVNALRDNMHVEYRSTNKNSKTSAKTEDIGYHNTKVGLSKQVKNEPSEDCTLNVEVNSAKFGNICDDTIHTSSIQQRKMIPTIPITQRILKSTAIESFFNVLTCPMFYVTAATNVCFYFLYHMYVVIIFDYALDRGVEDSDAKNVLFAFSIADLFGRLCLGWITDRKFISRPRFVMFCMTLIAIVFFVFPHATGYSSLILVSCLYGLLLGCTMVIFPILLVDFCGIELHAVAYGCMCFMNGFASFGRPFLIGYFRDTTDGSYSSMFYILGVLSLTASSLWLLEIYFSRKQRTQLKQIEV